MGTRRPCSPGGGLEGRIGFIDARNPVPATADAGSCRRVATERADAGRGLGVRPEGGASRGGNGRSGNADRGPGLEAGADAGVFYPCEKQGVRYTVVDPSAMTPAIEKKPVRR